VTVPVAAFEVLSSEVPLGELATRAGEVRGPASAHDPQETPVGNAAPSTLRSRFCGGPPRVRPASPRGHGRRAS